MNVGIHFNTKRIKATFADEGFEVDTGNFLEIRNVFTFTNEGISVGNDGFNKFLIEKEAIIYSLNQIVELNGLVVNKKQISVENCLSMLFSNLFKKIEARTGISKIHIVCVAIPYDKYYLWYDLISEAFTSLGISFLRIVSEPSAFFAQPSSEILHQRLNSDFLQSSAREYAKKSWYKKIFSKYDPDRNYGYLFISVSKDSSNISLVDYGQQVLQVMGTQYINNVSEVQFEKLALDYFLTEIGKDKREFLLDYPKNYLRIQQLVDDFINEPQPGEFYEVNLPYLLCKDGNYRTINVNIYLENLYSTFNSILNNLTNFIEKAINQLQNDQSAFRWRTEIGNIIIAGELINHVYIQKKIEKTLNKLFTNSKIMFISNNSMAKGALSCAKVLSGENKNFVSLEVIPFSVFIRLRGSEFIKVIKKDTTIPTTSEKYTFELTGEGKSRFAEIHLTTKEGDNFQSLNVWKIEVSDAKTFLVQINIDTGLKISVNAYSSSGQTLPVKRGDTFSFGGTKLEVGIKGKDIRQYILNQFNYLASIFKVDKLSIFEPDKTFYSMLKNMEPFTALRYLGHFLKLRSLPDVEMTESIFFEEQGVAGFISGSKISVPKFLSDDPYGFGYILAHELAHYILIHEESILLDDKQENEILTEIFVIFKGMGKLFLNGFSSTSGKLISSHTRGYLDEEIINYIHQIYFLKYNIYPPIYKENLTNEAVTIIKKLLK